MEQRIETAPRVIQRFALVKASAQTEQLDDALVDIPLIASQRGVVHTPCSEQLTLTQRLNTAEIQESNAAIRVKQVVAGMRVGVEDAAQQVGLEHEAPQRFGIAPPERIAHGADLFEIGAADELGGEHASTGAFLDHTGNTNAGIPGMDVGKTPLPFGLQPVVQFLTKALLDHLEHGASIHGARPQ